jgi:hypothetical protein
MTEPIKTGENSWIITLEEDPDTGELIMPLPAEALATNGWNLGDLLVWEMDKSGAIILRKSDDQNQPES